jgi:FAD:protein FMN transferase
MDFKILFMLCCTIILIGCQPPQYRIEKTEPLMGTFFDITILDANTSKAETAVNAAFSEMRRIEFIMSIYNESSQVYKLNKNGVLYNASNELIYVLKIASFYSNLSDGAFDITVQPILDLYTETYKVENRSPTQAEIESARKLINYKDIIIDGKKISFRKDGMKITLGGIAKGYAVDRAILILEEHGIKSALVNAGGNMRVIGAKEEGRAWNVALQNPRNKNDFITTFHLQNESISTSGDYERYFVENMSVHHIIDPKTGFSATNLISTTVVTKKAIDADALSTTVFVLGPEDGLALLKKLHVQGLIITKDKEILKSQNEVSII